MSELFDENNEERLSDDVNKLSSMSLDDRKEQLENKINEEMNSQTVRSGIPDSENGTNESTFGNTKISSPYDRDISSSSVGGVSDTARNALPRLNDNSGVRGSSFDNPYYKREYPNYGTLVGADYTDGAAYAPIKKDRMSSGLKSYLIVIVGLIVIFVAGFIIECVRTYNANGIFGGENGILSGDWDEYLDTDYDFGFNFGKDKDKEKDKKDKDDKDDKDEDTDDIFGSISDTDSDQTPENLKEPPSSDSVLKDDDEFLTLSDQPDDIDSGNYTAQKAFKKVENSVVNVMVYDGHIGDENYSMGTGSGIIVSSDGYIVTNSHVIGDSKSYDVEIITTDGKEYMAAIVGFDSRTDIAVLKISGKDLQAIEFVKTEQIEVGQDAIAVGNPGGVQYSNSLTRGIVSALDRTVSSNKLVPYIQTDAAINPGNSGGPLLNIAGQVMGINTIKIANTNYEGMGFAIPSNVVVSIANDIISKGYVSGRVRIGISGRDSAENAAFSTPAGVEIMEIADDSPFKNTEVAVGDIITGVNGKKVSGFTDLYSEFENFSPGDEVEFSICRPSPVQSNSKEFKVKVKMVADNGETQAK